MGLIISLGILSIICLIIVLFYVKTKKTFAFGFIMTTMFSAIFFTFLLGLSIEALFFVAPRHKEIKLNYNSLEMVVKEQRVNGSDALERVRITKEIIEMNEIINKHKTYHDNMWVGVRFSKEIADLEYLK